MKKIVLAGLVAVSLMAVSQQQASAWISTKFGVGLNWEAQSGGNNLLWGAWRNGQPPGPEAFGGAPGYAPQYGPMPQGFAPHAYAPTPQPYAPQGSFNASAEPPYAQQYGSPYQFANYPRPVYYYPPTYYYYYGR